MFNKNTFFLSAFLVWIKGVFLSDSRISPLAGLGLPCSVVSQCTGCVPFPWRLTWRWAPAACLTLTASGPAVRMTWSVLVWMVTVRMHETWGCGPQHPLFLSADLPCHTILLGNENQAAGGWFFPLKSWTLLYHRDKQRTNVSVSSGNSVPDVEHSLLREVF